MRFSNAVHIPLNAEEQMVDMTTEIETELEIDEVPEELLLVADADWKMLYARAEIRAETAPR